MSSGLPPQGVCEHIWGSSWAPDRAFLNSVLSLRSRLAGVYAVWSRRAHQNARDGTWRDVNTFGRDEMEGLRGSSASVRNDWTPLVPSGKTHAHPNFGCSASHDSKSVCGGVCTAASASALITRTLQWR